MPFFMLDTAWFKYVLPAVIFAFVAQLLVKGRYSRFLKLDAMMGRTGAEVARYILDKNGLYNVDIQMSHGQLSDHYSPRERVVRLSPDVYNGYSVSSVSIAAHEVGHALQHADKYRPVMLRSALVPIVNFGTNISWIFIILGMAISESLLTLGLIMFSLGFIFQLVTLPVEFNASRRAIIQLDNMSIPYQSRRGAKNVLQAAALTYVAGTMAAFGNLLRILALTGRLDNRDR